MQQQKAATMRVALYSLMIVLWSSATATSGVFVSDQYFSPVMDKLKVTVSAGQYTAYKFNVTAAGKIKVNARVLNTTFDDGSIWICSSTDFLLFQRKQRSSCKGVSRQRGEMEFVVNAPRAGEYYLVADNRFSLLQSKSYQITLVAPAVMDPGMREGMTEVLTKIEQFIFSQYDVQNFDFSIQPCGQSNAFSQTRNGNIVICSELGCVDVQDSQTC